MNKKKRENLNLFFSAFLVLGYIVCSYFFITLANGLPSLPNMLITIAVFVIFGLLLFYATRVGDGEPVKRFSPIILVVLVIPCFYIILAQLLPLPLHDQIAQASVVFILACIGLGYGIPYMFLSGFEIKQEEIEAEEETAVVEGGIREELEELKESENGETDPSELQPVEDRDMDESGLIDGEKIEESAASENYKKKNDNGEDVDLSKLEPVEDRDMDEPELIDGDKKEVPASSKNNKKQTKKENNVDVSELEPVEDRDMDEPELIDGEKKEASVSADKNNNKQAENNKEVDLSKLEPVEDRDMDEPELINGEEK